MPFAYNTERVSQAIEDGEQEIAEAVTWLVDNLVDLSAIRIHRNWSSSEERRQIVARATQVALLSVLTCDWATLDPETAWLHIERKQPLGVAQ